MTRVSHYTLVRSCSLTRKKVAHAETVGRKNEHADF